MCVLCMYLRIYYIHKYTHNTHTPTNTQAHTHTLQYNVFFLTLINVRASVCHSLAEVLHVQVIHTSLVLSCTTTTNSFNTFHTLPNTGEWGNGPYSLYRTECLSPEDREVLRGWPPGDQLYEKRRRRGEGGGGGERKKTQKRKREEKNIKLSKPTNCMLSHTW